MFAIAIFLARPASVSDPNAIMSAPPTPPENPGPEGPTGPYYDDGFGPPAEPCECYCLHCNRVFMSDGIWLQRVINGRDGFEGFWRCPTPNCGGAGFTFDIFPTDPEHPANAGWVEDDDDEDDEGNPFDSEGDEADSTGEYDPAEPKYAALDDTLDDEDDDLEGEEWKHGLEPGERPPEPPWVQQARQHWEQEQKKYDAPDERPRVVDWADRPDLPPPPPSGGGSDGEINESDIPF